MKNYLKIVAYLALSFAIGCGNQTTKKGGAAKTGEVQPANGNNSSDNEKYIVKGKITNEPNALLVLSEITPSKINFIDSTRADDKGNFTFEGSTLTEKIAFITINSTNPPGVPVYLNSGEKIKLEITNGELIKMETKGSESNEDLNALYNLYSTYNAEGMAINKKYRKMDPKSLTPAIRKQAEKEFSDWNKKGETMIASFIESHNGNAATYFASTYVLPKTPPSITSSALEKLKRDAPQTSFTNELDQRLSQLAPLSIGAVAPEIALNTPEGNTVALSSLKGKVVLIDFWASWCGPCRRENPNVVKMYQKYKDKGFEIYGVSLDNNKQRWQGAIIKDKLTWIHVSDLKGWKSVAAAKYKVGSIPYTVLLDKSGRIVAKNLRGASLEAKLEKMFD